MALEIRTRSTTYRVAATDSGSGLRALAWGDSASLEDPPAPPTVAGFDTPDDLLPHEFSVDGTRHVLASDLRVRRPDGTGGALVRLEAKPTLESTDDGDRLSARLVGDGVAVGLTWQTSRRHDVITRGTVISNTGGEPIALDRAFTGSFNVPLPEGAAIDALSGAWCEEYAGRRVLLPAGTFQIGSRQGVVSHLWAPVVTVSDPASSERGCWSVQVAWSGSWQLEVDATSRSGWVRIAGGSDDESRIVLRPGESFEAPPMVGLWAPDPHEAARRWHEYERADLLREAPRSITYNSWYATEFDVRADQQIALAEVAADLGCEMFVLDDGWFRGRHSDAAGLGDWEPDPAAFPDGLTPLVERVHALGMRFGLWVEPEGVNPDSDLYRAHPNWIHRSPTREPVTIRNQYVLDFGLPEVEEWALATLRRLLTGSGVDHLKWDMNRAITDGGPDDWSVLHTKAYHRILDTLRSEFPGVTLEACSGGGARVACSTLGRSDVVWPSDETGPRDRLAIQHGYLSAFPAAAMSSWVTHLDGLRDPRPASLEYRFAVAMCGVLGIGSDLTQWSDEERAIARRMIAVYKEIRPVVLGGEVTRHGDPRAHGYAVEYSQDGSGVVIVFGAPGVADPVTVPSRSLRGRLTAHLGEGGWTDDGLVVRMDPVIGAAILVADRDD